MVASSNCGQIPNSGVPDLVLPSEILADSASESEGLHESYSAPNYRSSLWKKISTAQMPIMDCNSARNYGVMVAAAHRIFHATYRLFICDSVEGKTVLAAASLESIGLEKEEGNVQFRIRHRPKQSRLRRPSLRAKAYCSLSIQRHSVTTVS